MAVTDPMRETSCSKKNMHKKQGLAAESEEEEWVCNATVNVSGFGSAQCVLARNGQRWHRIGRRWAQRQMK